MTVSFLLMPGANILVSTRMIIGAAEGILEFNVGREGYVQERGIDDLRVDAEFIQISNSRLHIS